MKYVNIYFRNIEKKHITIQHIDDEEFEKQVLENVERVNHFIPFDTYKGYSYTIVLLRQKGEAI